MLGYYISYTGTLINDSFNMFKPHTSSKAQSKIPNNPMSVELCNATKVFAGQAH